MKIRSLLACAATAAALSLGCAAASAMPAASPSAVGASTPAPAQVEKARVVCYRWGRCYRYGWRHYYYRPRYYGYYYHPHVYLRVPFVRFGL